MNLSQITSDIWTSALSQLPSSSKMTIFDYKLANLDWKVDLLGLRANGLITTLQNSNPDYLAAILQVGGTQSYYRYRLPSSEITIYDNEFLSPDDVINLYRRDHQPFCDLILVIDNVQPMIMLIYLALVLVRAGGTAVWRVNKTWRLDTYFNFLKGAFNRVELVALEMDATTNDLYLVGEDRYQDHNILELLYQLHNWAEYEPRYRSDLILPSARSDLQLAEVNDIISQWWL